MLQRAGTCIRRANVTGWSAALFVGFILLGCSGADEDPAPDSTDTLQRRSADASRADIADPVPSAVLEGRANVLQRGALLATRWIDASGAAVNTAPDAAGAISWPSPISANPSRVVIRIELGQVHT